jgi:hypothetical protein
MMQFVMFAMVLATANAATVCGVKQGSTTSYTKENCNSATEYCSGSTLLCTAFIASGAVCGEELKASGLSSKGVCVSTDQCAGQQDTDVCIPLKNVGDACSSVWSNQDGRNDGCGPYGRSSLTCASWNATVSTTYCKQKGAATGAYCKNSEVCAGVCNITSQCAAIGTEGDACTTDSTCEYRCHPPTLTCMPYLLVGATCEYNFECCPAQYIGLGGGCECAEASKTCAWSGGMVDYTSDCDATLGWAAETEKCRKFDATSATCISAAPVAGCQWCADAPENDAQCQWAPRATCTIAISGLATGTITYSPTECPVSVRGPASTLAPAMGVLTVVVGWLLAQ